MNTLQSLKERFPRGKMGITLFLALLLPLFIFALFQSTDLRNLAASTSSLEAEEGVLSGAATLVSDTAASNGKYIQFGNSTSSTAFQPSAPYFATFFYLWYKNPNTDSSWSYWTDSGNNPPNSWFSHYIPDPNPGSFDPTNELYSASNYQIFKWQVSKLAEARQEVAIASWWGPGTKEDQALTTILTDFMKRTDNPYPNLRWALYYEDEGFGDPSVSTLVADLTHIKSNITASPYFLKINNKPVIFVYGNASDEPGTLLTRWDQANSQMNNEFYIVLKLFGGYATASPQPDSWHQYAPAVRNGSHSPYSSFVSPGFWLDDNVSAERLPRNATEFETAVKSMVATNTTWKLVQTWNEWGEGTSVEPGEQTTKDASGKEILKTDGYPFKNLYVDILERNLPPLEQGVGSPITQSTPTPTHAQTSGDPILVAAGDIACGPDTATNYPCQQQATANVIGTLNPTIVMPLGDNQYNSGTLSNYQNYYDKSWGAFKSKTRPVIGNHEGGEGGSSAGYFDYFNGVGAQTGPAGDRSKGYYSFDLGSWHIVVLNTNCGKYSFNGSSTICDAGSEQEQWLKQDLANTSQKCILAAMHLPRFSSGHDGNNTTIHSSLNPLWQALYNAKTDVVLSGHSHSYERFALQNSTGTADSQGIRQFVVGTGGRDFTGWWTSSLSNSQVRNNNTFGVIKLALHASSYDWQFVPATGVNGYNNGTFTDHGTQGCH